METNDVGETSHEARPRPPRWHWWGPALAVLAAAGLLVGGLAAYTRLANQPVSLARTAQALGQPRSVSVTCEQRARSGYAYTSRCWLRSDGRFRIETSSTPAGAVPPLTRVFDGERLQEFLPQAKVIRVWRPAGREADRAHLVAPDWLFSPLPPDTAATARNVTGPRGERLRRVDLDFGGQPSRTGPRYPRTASLLIEPATHLPLGLEERFGAPEKPDQVTAWSYEYDRPISAEQLGLTVPQGTPVVDLDAERARLDQSARPVAGQGKRTGVTLQGLYCNEGGDLFVALLVPDSDTATNAVLERVATDSGLRFAGSTRQFEMASAVGGQRQRWDVLSCLQAWDPKRFPKSATVVWRDPPSSVEGVKVTRLPGDTMPMVYRAVYDRSPDWARNSRLARRANTFVDREYWDLAVPVLERAIAVQPPGWGKDQLQGDLLNARRQLGLAPPPQR